MQCVHCADVQRSRVPIRRSFFGKAAVTPRHSHPTITQPSLEHIKANAPEVWTGQLLRFHLSLLRLEALWSTTGPLFWVRGSRLCVEIVAASWTVGRDPACSSSIFAGCPPSALVLCLRSTLTIRTCHGSKMELGTVVPRPMFCRGPVPWRSTPLHLLSSWRRHPAFWIVAAPAQCPAWLSKRHGYVG